MYNLVDIYGHRMGGRVSRPEEEILFSCRKTYNKIVFFFIGIRRALYERPTDDGLSGSALNSGTSGRFNSSLVCTFFGRGRVDKYENLSWTFSGAVWLMTVTTSRLCLSGTGYGLGTNSIKPTL